MRCISADLPAATAIAVRKIAAAGLADRVAVQPLDFFADRLPKADVTTMGMILHDWNLEKKIALVKKAYDALPPGGAFVAVENIIDDARRENAFGLMMSLNMLVEFGEAFDFTGADFSRWCSTVGFARLRLFTWPVPPALCPIRGAVLFNPAERFIASLGAPSQTRFGGPTGTQLVVSILSCSCYSSVCSSAPHHYAPTLGCGWGPWGVSVTAA
jgi:hypothetical protein